MDARAAKLALARQKLKDHQVKKTLKTPQTDNSSGDAPPSDVQEAPNYPRDLVESHPIPNYPTDVFESHSVPIYTDTGHNFDPPHSSPFDYMSISAIEPEETPKPKVDLDVMHTGIPQVKEVNQNNQTYEISQPSQQFNQLGQTIPDVNVTELLISNKRNLEQQISDLQSQILQLESSQASALNENYFCKQQINSLQLELQSLQQTCMNVTEENKTKETLIRELKKQTSSLTDENNNLQEQLEFTKSMLSTKESESAALQSQLFNLQRQLEVTQLNLQQISNGNQISIQQQKKDNDSEILQQKILSLEHQLKTLQKERDQINLHYEHYVGELNEQLKTLAKKNEELTVEVNQRANRETSLIEQISDMEIRLQNYQIIAKREFKDESKVNLYEELKELQHNHNCIQASYEELKNNYEDVQKKYAESEAKIKELSQALEESTRESECSCTENINISKLSADISSDKIAAQRATEQNRKLKTDMQELEEAFVKISQDKLDLTEKVAAEKFLNRELTIKLAEFEEKAKDLHTKLMAKDEEMMRLQAHCRELTYAHEKLKYLLAHEEDTTDNAAHLNGGTKETELEHAEEAKDTCSSDGGGQHHDCHDHEHNEKHEHHCLAQTHNQLENSRIPKEDAMVKLQERFLKIMEDVADLSDEKHRLEHIILQLQNETDTICEYVALYQQQRSLLKKRDEERSAQIKLFQQECQQLKKQLEELSGIIIRLAKDKELAASFQTEPRCSDLAKVMNLLSNLKSSTLVDPCRSTSELKNFYPCSCCSGKLIDV